MLTAKSQQLTSKQREKTRQTRLFEKSKQRDFLYKIDLEIKFSTCLWFAKRLKRSLWCRQIATKGSDLLYGSIWVVIFGTTKLPLGHFYLHWKLENCRLTGHVFHCIALRMSFKPMKIPREQWWWCDQVGRCWSMLCTLFSSLTSTCSTFD